MPDEIIFELRRKALLHVRENLMDCLVAETEAERRLTAAESAIWRYRDDAMALSDDDSAVEAYAAWLPEGRRQVSAAQNALDRALAETICARAALAHAQAAISSVTAAESL